MKEINGKLLLGIGATVAVGCTCMLYYLLTYDYLTIRSPYVGYELGYQQANIGQEALLSPQMRDRTKATIESELKTNTEKYTYDEETQIAKTIDMDYLYNGRYELSAVLGSQSDRMMMSVHDSYAPVFLNLYPEIVIEENALKEKAELVEYFNIQDYDTDAEMAILADKIELKKAGSYTIRAMGYDTSGNFTEVEVPVRIVTSKEAQLRPEILTVNRQGVVPATEATRKKLGDKYLRFDTSMLNFGTNLKNGVVYENENDYNNKIKELQETKAKLAEEEKRFIQDLCKDGYDSTQDEEAKRKIEEQRNTGKLQDTKKVQEGIDSRKEQIEELRKQEEEEAKKKEEEAKKREEEVEKATETTEKAEEDYIQDPTPDNQKALEEAKRAEEEARRKAEEAQRQAEEAKKKEQQRQEVIRNNARTTLNTTKSKNANKAQETQVRYAKAIGDLREDKEPLNYSTMDNRHYTDLVEKSSNKRVYQELVDQQLPTNEKGLNAIDLYNESVYEYQSLNEDRTELEDEGTKRLEELAKENETLTKQVDEKLKELETAENYDSMESEARELAKKLDENVKTLEDEQDLYITKVSQKVFEANIKSMNIEEQAKTLSDIQSKTDKRAESLRQTEESIRESLCMKSYEEEKKSNKAVKEDFLVYEPYYNKYIPNGDAHSPDDAKRLYSGYNGYWIAQRYIFDRILDKNNQYYGKQLFGVDVTDTWGNEDNIWADASNQDWYNNTNYLSLGQVFGNGKSLYKTTYTKTSDGKVLNGSMGTYIPFESLDDAVLAKMLLEDLTAKFYNATVGKDMGFEKSDCSIRWIDGTDENKYDKPVSRDLPDIAKKELNSNTTLTEEEKKLIKMDKEGYYLYHGKTRLPETSYETGWYIKWQGIKVQDSTVITEGGQISQIKP